MKFKSFDQFIGESFSAPNFELPADHEPAIRVPKGGSSCSTCRFWTGQECSNEYYIKWNGSGQIPAPPDEFCSDWYLPKEGSDVQK